MIRVLFAVTVSPVLDIYSSQDAYGKLRMVNAMHTISVPWTNYIERLGKVNIIISTFCIPHWLKKFFVYYNFLIHINHIYFYAYLRGREAGHCQHTPKLTSHFLIWRPCVSVRKEKLSDTFIYCLQVYMLKQCR